MISDELTTKKGNKSQYLENSNARRKLSLNCLVHEENFIVNVYREIVGLYDQVVFGVHVRRESHGGCCAWVLLVFLDFLNIILVHGPG